MFGELNYLILVKILQKYSGLYILVLVTTSSMRQILWIVSCASSINFFYFLVPSALASYEFCIICHAAGELEL